MKLTIDFESRSTVDLKKCGVHVYARHPTTEVLCCAVKEDDKDPFVWVPHDIRMWVLTAACKTWAGSFCEEDETERLFNLLENAEEIEAHNAGFEIEMWDQICTPKHGWPKIDVSRIFCSAAKAAVCGLPRALDAACAALNLGVRKDKAGYALMLKMCKPLPRTKKHPELRWAEAPEQFEALFSYCAQDVEAEYALSQKLPPLSEMERRVWLADLAINRRGIRVDVGMTTRIIEGVEEHTQGLLDQTERVTGGEVSSPKKIAASLRWLKSRGVDMPCLDKAAVAEALAREDLPEDAREFLLIRKSLGKSSTSKYEALLRATCPDNRIRGTLLYHAASTGRWGGKLFQPQNLPRGLFSDTERCIDAIKRHGFGLVDALWGDRMDVASTCVRGMLVASPGHRLIAQDYSSVEARGLAFLAGQQSVLDAFSSGLDLYKVEAAGTFGVPYEEVTKAQRQVGKTQVLALGYAGGIGAFAAMAKNYGIDLETLPPLVFPMASPDEFEKSRKLAVAFVAKSPGAMSLDAAIACDIIKAKWRENNRQSVAMWYGLAAAASDAVASPGETGAYRDIAFRVGSDFLRCRLPSGRLLYYPFPEIRGVETPWGDVKPMVTHMGVDSASGKWMRFVLTGGRLTENVVQAWCRDLLAEAILRLEAAGYPVVLHVHDEIVGDVPNGFGSTKRFGEIMAEAPAWAAGCPIAADGWEGQRYHK